VDVAFSTATPTLGQTVTATIQDPHIKFNPNVASTGLASTAGATAPLRYGFNFDGQLPGPLQGPDSTHLRPGSGPQAVVVAADSSSLTFQAPPNAAGGATVVSFVFPGGFSLPLPTRTGITAPNVGTTIDAAFSSNTPAPVTPVTLTAPAGFRFNPLLTADTVKIGGQIAVNLSVAANGSTIDVLPIPGSVGIAEISGVQPATAPQFTLTMPTIQTASVEAVTPLEGTDDITTAPELTVPTAGNQVLLNDGGTFDGVGDDCCFGGFVRFYKITLTATTTLTGTLDWFEGQDMGLYWIGADGVTPLDPAFAGDSKLGGPTGHPETSTVTLAAGTYFIGVVNFGTATSAAGPHFFQLLLKNP